MTFSIAPHVQSPFQVPEFQHAATAGLIRPVPQTPPPFIPGARSGQIFLRGVIVMVVLVAATLKFVGVTPAVLMAFLSGWLMVNVAAHRQAEELIHGYSTTLSVRRRRHRPDPSFNPEGPWDDFRGVWLFLHSPDVITAAPNLGILPPGYYPAPQRDGTWRYWTGKQWSRWKVRQAPPSRHLGSGLAQWPLSLSILLLGR